MHLFNDMRLKTSYIVFTSIVCIVLLTGIVIGIQIFIYISMAYLLLNAVYLSIKIICIIRHNNK